MATAPPKDADYLHLRKTHAEFHQCAAEVIKHKTTAGLGRFSTA
jgi:hypothetical protein